MKTEGHRGNAVNVCRFLRSAHRTRRAIAVKRCLMTLSVVAVLAATAGSIDRAHFTELNRKARELSRQKDWPGLRAALIEIGQEMPAPTPAYMLRMASVETHLGNNGEAIQWLKRYAAMGLRYDVAADEGLKPLLAEAAFAPVAEEMKARTMHVQKAEAVCTIPLPDLMPEDLTFDKLSRTFVVSSIQHHGLYRISLPRAGAVECGVKEIPLEDQATAWPVLAVSADTNRNLLWMTASAMPGFTGFAKEDQGKAALFAIDGHSGKVLRRFDLASSGPAVLGDMSVAPNGTVYLSDSVGGGIYRVQGELKGATLEKIGGDFFSPQTPVLAHDGKRLFVPDYSMGIGIVELPNANTTIDQSKLNASRRLEYLPHPENVAVTGLDGLYLDGDSLVGIQNGTEPERIVRFRLNSAQTEITSSEVIEQSTDRLGDPTHVVGLDGWFYVSANVGWDKVDDHGQLKSGQHFTAPILLRFR